MEREKAWVYNNIFLLISIVLLICSSFIILNKLFSYKNNQLLCCTFNIRHYYDGCSTVKVVTDVNQYYMGKLTEQFPIGSPTE